MVSSTTALHRERLENPRDSFFHLLVGRKTELTEDTQHLPRSRTPPCTLLSFLNVLDTLVMYQ